MGLFIAFEGLDGSGQSTQSKKLENWFRERHYTTILTKEPTVGLIGGFIKAALRKEWKTDPTTLQMLFSADRSHHIHSKINPALKQDKVVITDRYFFSTLAFGSVDQEVDLSVIEKINSQFRVPDMTFYIDVPAEICMERMKVARFGAELFEEKEKLERVRKSYLKMVNRYPNFFRVDGTQSIEDVHDVVVEIVKREMSNKNFSLQKFL